MTILIHTAITLLIFISTILSGNPNIICIMVKSENICAEKIIEKTKQHCSSSKEKEAGQNCFQKTETSNCDLSTEEKIKKCYKCYFFRPIKSAVLSEQKLPIDLKSITLFSKITHDTSNIHLSNLSKTSIPFGIHKTISSTILLL